MQSEIITLAQSVEELEITISRHLDRISPVRYNPPQPASPPDGKGSVGGSELCELASAIRQSRQRIERASGDLRFATDQIQL